MPRFYLLVQMVEWKWKKCQMGYEIVGLDVVGIQRSISISSIFKNLKFPLLLLKSLRNAKKVVKDFNPNIVIGVEVMLVVLP